MQNIHHHSFPGFPKRTVNHFVKAVIFLLLLGFGILTAEPLFDAKVYRQDSQELLFHHYNTRTVENSILTLKHFYLMPDSTVSAEDVVVLEDGKIVSTYTRFPLVGEVGTLTRIEDKLLMKFETTEKQKERLLDFPEDMLLGPIFVDFIMENWQELNSGEKVRITLPAPNVLKVANFNLELVENSYSKEGFAVIEMSVSSIFLKLFIGSSYFVFDTSTQRLREIHGATILKTKKGDKWSKSTDASIYYNYLDEEKIER